MNTSTVEIHEFSTGIRPERTADGGWISRGFAGQYMNATFTGNIPDAVERSIANREFALTEGASSDQPAVIGRVVGTAEDAWSVIAVVTRGRDEMGRSLTVYRYFFCQGDKNLWLILSWWESQAKPTFDPFDYKTPGICNLFSMASAQRREAQPEVLTISTDTPGPILLLPEQQYDLQSINTLAIRKFNTHRNGQAISWAFNVEALEHPRRFQVIHAASTRAYENLQRAIATVPQNLVPPVSLDEEALKSAIRGLINRSQVKPEVVKAIAQSLEKDQITSEYWHTLFDGEGAKTAIQQKMYSPQMVRLMTLRAMVIPETLPEFLAWLNIKDSKKTEENQNISLEFQSAIRDEFPDEKLVSGIKFILPKLLQEKITPESVKWLLMIKNSAWFSCRKAFIIDIHTDLKLIAQYFNSPPKTVKFPYNELKCEPETWNELIKSWKSVVYSDYYKLSYYKPFAKLFEQIKEYALSAYFYQVSDRVVPKNVFIKASPDPRRKVDSLVFLGLTLEREINLSEHILDFLTRKVTLPIYVIIPLLFIFILIGLVIDSTFSLKLPFETATGNRKESTTRTSQNNTINSEQWNSQISNNSGNIKGTNSDVESSDNIPKNIKEAAIKDENFNKTQQSIDKIISEIITSKPYIEKQEVVNEIKLVLKIQDLDYATAKDKSKPAWKTEREKLSEAIYRYQKDNFGEKSAYGYIVAGQQTSDDIKKLVKLNLGIQSN